MCFLFPSLVSMHSSRNFCYLILILSLNPFRFFHFNHLSYSTPAAFITVLRISPSLPVTSSRLPSIFMESLSCSCCLTSLADCPSTQFPYRSLRATASYVTPHVCGTHEALPPRGECPSGYVLVPTISLVMSPCWLVSTN